MILTLPVWGGLLPAVVMGQGSLHLSLGGLMQGAFLANGEAAGGGLLGVLLVHFAVLTLEAGGVKTVGQNSGESCNVLSGFQFFHIPVYFVFCRLSVLSLLLCV